MSEMDELLDGLDMGQVDAQTFATIVTTATADQLKTVFATPEWRTRVLDEIFRRMGEHLRPDRASHVYAVVHWRLTGGSDPDGYDHYETVIEDGTCAVNRQWTREPRVTITLSPLDFVRLITQTASAPILFVTGKVKVKGDLGFAAGLTGLFDLPRA